MKVYVNFGEDYIQIQADTVNAKIELAYWDKKEWEDDSEVVFSIANAVKLAYENPNKLIELLKVEV